MLSSKRTRNGVIITQTDYHVFKAVDGQTVEKDPRIDPQTGETRGFYDAKEAIGKQRNNAANSALQAEDILKIKEALQHSKVRRITGNELASNTSYSFPENDPSIPTPPPQRRKRSSSPHPSSRRPPPSTPSAASSSSSSIPPSQPHATQPNNVPRNIPPQQTYNALRHSGPLPSSVPSPISSPPVSILNTNPPRGNSNASQPPAPLPSAPRRLSGSHSFPPATATPQSFPNTRPPALHQPAIPPIQSQVSQQSPAPPIQPPRSQQPIPPQLSHQPPAPPLQPPFSQARIIPPPPNRRLSSSPTRSPSPPRSPSPTRSPTPSPPLQAPRSPPPLPPTTHQIPKPAPATKKTIKLFGRIVESK